MPKNPRRREPSPKIPKTRRLEYERLALNIANMREESEFDYWVQSHVPEAWDTLEEDVDVEEPKVKITLLLDRSVAKFYRAMGNGYQARVNRILATFAQMRMAQIRKLQDMMTLDRDEVERLRRKWMGGGYDGAYED